MKAYESVIRIFEKEGVEDVFTLMSEDVIELLSEIHDNWDDEIQLIHTRHEQGAAAMADGYSRASGEIAVCIVGRGPGVAQTGTSMLTARNQESDANILYLVPEPKLSEMGDDKEFEQEAYLNTMVGEVVSIRSPETLVPKFRDVFRRLRLGEGPIAVQVAWDVLIGNLEAEDDLADYRPIVPEPSGARLQPDEERISDTIDLYLDSDVTRPPVIVAGRGAVQADAKDALEELAQRTNAYLCTTLQARDYFSDHPFSLGFVGNLGSDLANERIAQSDFILAVGCSLNNHTTDSGYLFRDEAKIVHVDTDPASLNRHTSVDIGILGDAKLTARTLLQELEDLQIDRSGEFWTEKERQQIADHSVLSGRESPEREGLIDPREVIRNIDQVFPENRLVVHDAGHHVTWVLDGITISHPDNHIWTIDFSAIGQGLPIGIGAAIATDERACITFCGDAGFMMSIQELETAVRQDVPITFVVMNDGALGAEYHVAPQSGYSGEATLIESPDFAAIAESVGADGYTVRSSSDLDEISDVLGQEPSSPVVIDCKVDRDVRNRFYE